MCRESRDGSKPLALVLVPRDLRLFSRAVGTPWIASPHQAPSSLDCRCKDEVILLRALLTGIAGFAGSHLAEYLLGLDQVEVYGTVRDDNRAPNIAHLRSRLQLFSGDIGDFEFVKSVVDRVQPDHIFHLAAQASAHVSWKHPGPTFTNNVLGEINLFEAIIQSSVRSRVLIVGSADEYGVVLPSEVPVRETNPLRPNNPYAVSKIAQDMLGFQYFASHKLEVVRVRPFNHIGPRQSEVFVVSSFAKQIAEAERGLREAVVLVGNLEARRDFTDVRDIVRGYWLAVTRGEPGEVYNLGSGVAPSVAEVLHALLGQSHLSIRVEQDPSRLRPSDVPLLVCDYSKFRSQTEWQPRFPLEETLSEVLDYWRGKIAEAC